MFHNISEMLALFALKETRYSTLAPGPGRGGGGGGRKVPAAHNSKSNHGIEMKLGRVVENHNLINCGVIITS